MAEEKGNAPAHDVLADPKGWHEDQVDKGDVSSRRGVCAVY